MAARFVVFSVTTGVTVATCTAVPLETLSVVTTAVRLPAVAGSVEKVTVSEFVVAAVTLPMAPSSKLTVSLLAIGSKPKPSIVMVLALAVKFLALSVTTGVTVATCAAVPLETLSTIATAVRLPAIAGSVEKVTVSEFVVAAVTLPMAPSLKLTVSLAAVGSNPKP